MEKFVLFCFKPCLKGENNKEYYTVLEVSSKATQDEIKKAFKKKSLALHPVSSIVIIFSLIFIIFFHVFCYIYLSIFSVTTSY